jgi:flagellar biosynthesis protein FlhF
MRLKSYFADTVESAMALAARELGDEAMLVYSRESAAETRGLGRYEVVFANEGGRDASPPMPSVEAEAGALSLEQAPAVPPPDRDGYLWGEVERRLSRLEFRLAGAAAESRPAQRETANRARNWQSYLEDQGVRDVLAAELVLRAQDSEMGSRTELSSGAVGDAAAGALHCDRGEFGPGAVAVLVGPPGVGKTSTAVKAAYCYAARYGTMPRLVSLDTRRALGAEELGHYARVLGSEFAVLRTEREIERYFGYAGRSCADAPYTIVDTAGWAPGDSEGLTNIRNAIEKIPRKEVHLILSAAMRTADLLGAAERFERLAVTRLMFSRLDETTSFGGIWTLAAKVRIPVSFVSNGPKVPDDFREAAATELASLLVAKSDATLAESLAATGTRD